MEPLIKNINIFAEDGIDTQPIIDYVMATIGPWIGIASFVAALGVVGYIAIFWLSYLFKDEEEKENAKVKWKKDFKTLMIVLTVGAGLGTLLMAVGAVVGIDLKV